MSVSFARPWLLIILPFLVGFLVYAWRANHWHLPQTRRRAVLAVRVAIMTFLVLALAGTALHLRVEEQSVMYTVDLSESTKAGLGEAEELIRQAEMAKGPGDRSGVVVFGRKPAIDQPLHSEMEAEIASVIDGSSTNIAGGLSLAASLLPPDTRRRIVLISDGQENLGDAVTEAARLWEKGIRVDVLPLTTAGIPEHEVAVHEVTIPPRLYSQEKYNVVVEIRSTFNTRGTLSIYQNRALFLREEVDIKQGSNEFLFTGTAGEPGVVEYSARVSVSDDYYPENNEAGAASQVLGPPKVLVVNSDGRADTSLGNALVANGVTFDTVDPGRMPQDLKSLMDYEAVILEDIPAAELGVLGMNILKTYVRDLGRGLLVIGGDNAYGLGGYTATPLEEILPVEMQIKDPRKVPPSAILYVIDRSGSMSGQKVELAKEAVIRSLESVRPADYAGVIAFDDLVEWVVVPQKVENKDTIAEQVATIRGGGGTDIYPAVAAAAGALKEVPTSIKHVILLTDGHSATGGDYYSLLSEMGEAGMTLSTVAIGEGADQGLLSQLAALGSGRYYYVADPTAIPTIISQETILAMRSYRVEETFTPIVASANPMTRGFIGFPELDGYVATSPRGRSELVFISHRGDPVLATWNYGLGRATAWTSDIRGKYTAKWLSWEEFPRFVGGLLRYILPDVEEAGLSVSVEQEDQTASITVTSDITGEVAPVKARVSGPEGDSQELKLEPVAPGVYEGSFRTIDSGTYIITTTEALSRVTRRDVSILTKPYSEEFRLKFADEIQTGYLQMIASAGGGEVLTDPKQAFSSNLAPAYSKTELASLLILLSLVLLPLDVGIRRVFLDREAVLQVAQAVKRLLPRRDEQEQASSPVLTRLKERKDEVRDTALKKHVEEELVPKTETKQPREKSPALKPEKAKTTKERSKGRRFTSRLLEAKRRRD